MSYTKQNFTNGQVLKAEHLNAMEDAIYDFYDKENSEKTVLLVGDSLMAGNGWTGGYGNCIKEMFPNFTIHNYAVSGTMLFNDEILEQCYTYYNAGLTEPDIIIVDGGGNDFLNRKDIGECSMDTNLAPDTTNSVCSYLEKLFSTIRTTWGSAKLLFIIPHSMYMWDDGSTVPGVPSPKVQKEYWDAVRNVCEKWGVPIADTFKNGNVNYNATSLSTFFMDDDTMHLNEAGYRRVAPIINREILNLL